VRRSLSICNPMLLLVGTSIERRSKVLIRMGLASEWLLLAWKARCIWSHTGSKGPKMCPGTWLLAAYVSPGWPASSLMVSCRGNNCSQFMFELACWFRLSGCATWVVLLGYPVSLAACVDVICGGPKQLGTSAAPGCCCRAECCCVSCMPYQFADVLCQWSAQHADRGCHVEAYSATGGREL
jgi:hypothetical protein